MFFRTRLVSFVSVLVAVCALAPATASAREGDHFSIEPGHRMVFICGWSYRPIARQHALHIGGDRLEVRKVIKTSVGERALFAHRVEVRTDDGGRYRTVINRGNQTIDYRDDCGGGGR